MFATKSQSYEGYKTGVISDAIIWTSNPGRLWRRRRRVNIE